MITAQDSELSGGVEAAPVPGFVIVFSGAAPALAAHRIEGRGLVVGRELDGVSAEDDRISRQHAQIRVSDGAFVVTDLGSRNGTHVDGALLTGAAPGVVIRTGRTVGVLVPDVRRYEHARVDVLGDTVVGPTLAAAWRQVERAARAGDALLLTGESGSGKELAARAFHAATGASGELVAVNCAAIPAGVAERLLFGAKRGAYSGADRDADGYLAAADGGTIFLDEIGELEPAIQSKLLRVLETGELLALGAARPTKIAVRIVAATLRDLRAEVAAKRFRDDLYYRIGRPEVRLPALRDRPEDQPHLIAVAIRRAAPGLAIHPGLVEACLLRAWPGNTRELLGELRRAALAARDAGRDAVRADDLDATAGRTIEASGEVAIVATGESPKKPAALPDAAAITRALEAEGGNVTRAAKVLGIHRNQLRRYLAKQPGDDDSDAE